jgi:hypothetical protein
MKIKLLSATVIFWLSASLIACSPIQQIEQLSTAQTCSEVNDILGEVGATLVKIAANPLEIEAYLLDLRGYSDDLRQLRPLDPELDGSLDDVATGVDTLLDATNLMKPGNLLRIPDGIATVRKSLQAAIQKCERLMSA